MIDQPKDPNISGLNDPRLDLERDAGPDADLSLLVDYLACDLDPERMVAVQDRLASDDAFYGRMETIELALSGIRQVIGESTDPEIVALLAATPAARPVRATPSRGVSLGRTVSWLLDATRRLRSWVNVGLVRQLAPQFALWLVIVTGGATAGAYAFRHMNQIQRARETWVLAHWGVTDRIGGRWGVELPGGSQVDLEPRSHMRSEQIEGSFESIVHLEGAATVSVTDSTRGVMVVTPGGDAFLRPGRFRIALEDSSTLWVRVDSGVAQLRGRTPSGGPGRTPGESSTDGWITLRPGQHGRVHR